MYWNSFTVRFCMTSNCTAVISYHSTFSSKRLDELLIITLMVIKSLICFSTCEFNSWVFELHGLNSSSIICKDWKCCGPNVTLFSSSFSQFALVLNKSSMCWLILTFMLWFNFQGWYLCNLHGIPSSLDLGSCSLMIWWSSITFTAVTNCLCFCLGVEAAYASNWR